MHFKGFTIWLTGLPGAGKTTLAQLIEKKLHTIGLPVEILDGDVFRRRLGKDLGFTRQDRDENIRRITFVANLLSRVGAVAIVAAISPNARARNDARLEIGNFVEVFVQCPLDICIRRDPKGLYEKARRGEVANLTGPSDPYEEPTTPNIIVHTNQEIPQQSVEKIFQWLFTRNFLPTPSNMQESLLIPALPGGGKGNKL